MRLQVYNGECRNTPQAVLVVGSKEEVDAREVAVNLRGEVREDAKDAIRRTLPSRIFNSC